MRHCRRVCNISLMCAVNHISVVEDKVRLIQHQIDVFSASRFRCSLYDIMNTNASDVMKKVVDASIDAQADTTV